MSGANAGQILSNDLPAASRYLEARLSEFAEDVFDIDICHLNQTDSYDGQLKEITQYVPALPLALINSQTGIGTGYACNSIAFNLSSIPKAIKALQTGQSVAKALGVPDFTCFSRLIKDEALLDLHETGHASLSLIGCYDLIDFEIIGKRNKKRKAFRITELPKGSAESFTEQVALGVEQEKITDISALQTPQTVTSTINDSPLMPNKKSIKTTPDVREFNANVKDSQSSPKIIKSYNSKNRHLL
jgi:DNA gyrase/topoisomerase IV subunit A